MAADRREKIADCIHFITEKATLEEWSQVAAGGDALLRLAQDRREQVTEECGHVSLRTFEFEDLTKGNERALEHLKMALKFRFLWFLKNISVVKTM